MRNHWSNIVFISYFKKRQKHKRKVIEITSRKSRLPIRTTEERIELVT